MSHLQDLIDELCQRGVEYVAVGDICSTITDYTAAGSFANNAKNVKYLKGTPDFAQLIRTTDLKSNFENDENFIYVDKHAFDYLWRVNLNQESLILPNVGNCGEVYHAVPEDFPYENNVLGPNAILVRSKLVNNRFLYHLFSASEFQGELTKITSSTGQTKFNKTNFKKIKIPIPPMPVQEEIVRILDKFTELNKELNKELTLRKKQYEYYRDKLLTFEDGSVEKFEKIGDFLEYEQPTKYLVNKTNYSDEYKTPVLTAGKSFILGYTNETEGIYQASKNNPVIIFDDFTTSFQWVDFPFKAKSSAMKILKPKKSDECSIRYLYFLMQTIKFNPEGHKRHWISKYSNIEIPIPPLSEQERIANILDKFDTLTNSLTQGIPAEIKARQKQYEYYRDKLLDFKELSG